MTSWAPGWRHDDEAENKWALVRTHIDLGLGCWPAWPSSTVNQLNSDFQCQCWSGERRERRALARKVGLSATGRKEGKEGKASMHNPTLYWPTPCVLMYMYTCPRHSIRSRMAGAGRAENRPSQPSYAMSAMRVWADGGRKKQPTARGRDRARWSDAMCTIWLVYTVDRPTDSSSRQSPREPLTQRNGRAREERIARKGLYSACPPDTCTSM